VAQNRFASIECIALRTESLVMNLSPCDPVKRRSGRSGRRAVGRIGRRHCRSGGWTKENPTFHDRGDHARYVGVGDESAAMLPLRVIRKSGFGSFYCVREIESLIPGLERREVQADICGKDV
jgi:hypothetical protein